MRFGFHVLGHVGASMSWMLQKAQSDHVFETTAQTVQCDGRSSARV